MKPLGFHKTKIVFLTKYVCRSSVDFLGPVGERYAGLYYSFMERFRFDYDFYWYTGDSGITYEYQKESNALQPLLSSAKKNPGLSLIKALLSFCLGNFRSRKILVVSYPYFPKSLLLAVLLFLLKPFRLTVIVDVQDLPRETPGTVGYLLWRIIDELYYFHADFIVNAMECAKLYARKARGRIVIIPMAAHHNVIIPKPSAGTRNGLTLGYIGTISKARGFPELIEVVKNLREEGFAIDLVINGSNPEKINLGAYPWVRLYELQPLERLSEVLRTFDVGVIPYVDSEYWGRMSITKMATYMAAGLPILTLQLTETSNILAKWECGISVKDWDDMVATLTSLCNDKPLLEKLAKNARTASVEEYNWANQVERMGQFVVSVCK